MISTDDKIIEFVIGTLSIEDLENIISKKKEKITPMKLSHKENYKSKCKAFLKRKLFAPIYR